MRSDMTLGEVKERCAEMTGKYGDNSCDHCDMKFGCCEPPDAWKLEAQAKMCAQPNWEEMFHKCSEECRLLHMKAEDSYAKANMLEAENRKLRTIVSVVETMIGRKFDV